MNPAPPALRVVEFGSGVGVPFAGKMFVNFGADVVKAERGDGDWTRSKPPLIDHDGERVGALFHFLNAGKRSILLDDDNSDSAIAALWSWADIVLVDEEFHADERISGRFTAAGPKVVTAVTPYGLTGPEAKRPGTASTAFARCGEGSITPAGIGYRQFPEAPPLGARGKVADIDAGVIAVVATLAAVGSTDDSIDRLDPPVQIDVSVLETQVSHNRWLPSNFSRTGWIETRASTPYPVGGMLPCQDGHAMFLPATDRHWQAFVEIVGRPDWALADNLVTREGRVAAGEDLRERIMEWAADVPKAALLEAGLAEGVPLGPYRSMTEVAACPQLNQRGFFVQYGEAGSGMKVPGLPAPGFAGQVAMAPGLGRDDIASLRAPARAPTTSTTPRTHEEHAR